MRTLGWAAAMSVCVLSGCARDRAIDELGDATPTTLMVSALDAGDSRVDLRVTAPDGRVTLERSLFVRGGEMSLDRMGLPLGSDAISVRVVAGDDELVGSADAGITFAEGATGTPVFLKVTIGGERPVRVVVDRPPQVQTVEVSRDGQGKAHLSASTKDADQDRVILHWSASGLDPAVPPGDTISLEEQALARSNDSVHLVAQDEAGAFAVAHVIFQPRGSCSLCGSHIVRTVELPVDTAPCAAAQASCIAHCDRPTPRGQEAAAARCYDGCAVALALCLVDN